MRKKFVWLLVFCLLLPSNLFLANAAGDSAESTDSLQNADTKSDFYLTNYISYQDYLSQQTGLETGQQEPIVYEAGVFQASGSEGGTLQVYEEQSAAVAGEGEELSLTVEVPESNFYNIILDYYPVEDGSASIKFELAIDGSVPFQEAESISLRRIWKESGEKDYDAQGNQIRLPSTEAPAWIKKAITDSSGFAGEPFRFWLEAGSHTITFSVFQNTLAVGGLTLETPTELPSYQTVSAEYEKKGHTAASEVVRLEAEELQAKSDRSIVITSDKTSPVTVPYSASKIVYNTVGGDNWKTVGEWVEWEMDVPEDGLYTIVLRFKQDTKSGDVSFRTLYIDGEVPFAEAKALAFSYSSGWQTQALGNDDGAYQFYLEAGTHTLRLEATLGSYNEVIARVNDTLTYLNDIYTDIMVITGPSPDKDRDYQFEKIIPDVLENMGTAASELRELECELEELTGQTGGESTAVIRRLYIELEKMQEDSESISRRLKNYKSDITSLSTWINERREQPLQLDYLMLSNEEAGVPKDKSGFFATIKYYLTQFFYSFKMDYSNVGNKDVDVEQEITVWISSGRDQADIIRQLANESFVPEYGIGVNVQLVSSGALMPATLADVGPDVYIGMAQTEPVEYALRHAVVDLSQFPDFEEVATRFYEESMTSFRLDEGVYALPDTMSYPMLFYRKDILGELGIQEEDLKTWDSLLQTVLPELDMNNLDFGLSPSISSFGSQLYQYGGSFYNEEHTASAFHTAEAIAAFETLTTMYTDYGIPKSYDFANRFRSGQMPLAVADFTSYNQLSIFAPEIEGRWSMCPIPGVEDASGNVNYTAMCTVTGSVILSKSEEQEASWKFLKWWTSAEIQARYGSELETVMGTGARYATANIVAMRSVEWDRGIKEALEIQQQSIQGMPRIAGGYYTQRSFDFAFRDVVYNGKNLRETIQNASASITAEIENKRKEFYGDE